MAIVNILAFVVLILVLSVSFNEKIVDVLPSAACILILVLYLLAFVRGLSAIDWIGSVFLILSAAAFGKFDREKKRRLLAEIREKLSHPGVIAAVLVLVGTAFLVNGRITTWWDDVNFWAADVKSLYALDGFAAKYANAASEFGDYPPGIQLMKWWFVHLSPGSFSEGLMFAGYYFCVFVFLTPLFGQLRGRNPVIIGLSAICLWAFPSVAEAFYCRGMCADLVMAVIYGAVLSSVFNAEGRGKVFYYLRLALYLAVLVLVKSVGFLWALFALVFLWFWQLKAPEKKAGTVRGLLFVTAAPAVTGGSWMLFCLAMRRVAKLTGAAVSIAAGNTPVLLPGTGEKLLKTFAEAFVIWPLHRSRTWALDFSPLGMFLLICLMIFIFYRIQILKKPEMIFLGVFLPVSGLVFYGINLLGHMTIFAAETQYLDPYSMVSSIERYGAPFTVGSLYLLADILLRRKNSVAPNLSGKGKAAGFWEKYSVYLVCFIFVALSANWHEIFYGLHGYRAQLEEEKEVRRDMITAESAAFLETAARLNTGAGARVLYLKDASVSQWVKNTYVAFEASPVSLIFGSLDPANMSSGDLWNVMDASHAGYLYADPIKGDPEALFAPYTEEFQMGILYRIVKENGRIRLEDAGLSVPAVKGGRTVIRDTNTEENRQ